MIVGYFVCGGTLPDNPRLVHISRAGSSTSRLSNTEAYWGVSKWVTRKLSCTKSRTSPGHGRVFEEFLRIQQPTSSCQGDQRQKWGTAGGTKLQLCRMQTRRRARDESAVKGHWPYWAGSLFEGPIQRGAPENTAIWGQVDSLSVYVRIGRQTWSSSTDSVSKKQHEWLKLCQTSSGSKLIKSRPRNFIAWCLMWSYNVSLIESYTSWLSLVHEGTLTSGRVLDSKRMPLFSLLKIVEEISRRSELRQ